MIDFKKLNSIYGTTTVQKPGGVVVTSLNTIQQERHQARDTFRETNDNIKAAESLKVTILKGTKCGESAELLLLDAARCIGHLTSDDEFCEQIAEDLALRHQLETGMPAYISMETQHRLHLMKRCIEDALRQYDDRQ